MMQQVGEALVLLGALLTLLAAVGVVRFRDVFARMHALSKATTAGVIAALGGAAMTLSTSNDITSMLFAAALQVITNPVSGIMLARATYVADGIATDVDTVDHLATDP